MLQHQPLPLRLRRVLRQRGGDDLVPLAGLVHLDQPGIELADHVDRARVRAVGDDMQAEQRGQVRVLFDRCRQPQLGSSGIADLGIDRHQIDLARGKRLEAVRRLDRAHQRDRRGRQTDRIEDARRVAFGAADALAFEVGVVGDRRKATVAQREEAVDDLVERGRRRRNRCSGPGRRATACRRPRSRGGPRGS